MCGPFFVGAFAPPSVSVRGNPRAVGGLFTLAWYDARTCSDFDRLAGMRLAQIGAQYD